MDKQFWLDIRENQYAAPTQQNILALTEELFSYIGSADPDLRDTIAYETFANWLDQGLYHPDQIRAYILRLLLNLQNGLGDCDTETVFERAFSILFLAEIVHHNNQEPILDADEIHNILNKGLAYLEAEADPRGYIPTQGWAHALAHTADLFFVLAQNPYTHAEDHVRILAGIASKLVAASNWVYIHGEDDRLARAVLAILERDLLDAPGLKQWFAALVTPAPQTWKGAWSDEQRTRAYFNVRNFLRSLTLRVITHEALPHQAELQAQLLEANTNLRPY